MQIKVLMENTSVRSDLICEHGLSLYLEAGGKRILFDAGQTDAFAENAAKMGVDLKKVDAAILSHGHYDHGGGMLRFLEINAHAPLYIHERAFERHFNGTEKEIGLHPALRQHPRIIRTRDQFEISPHLQLCALNARKAIYPLSNEHMNRLEGERMLPDLFEHEQYLVIHENGRRIVISGCSHKGVLNLLSWLQPDILIGGFHWKHLQREGEGKAQLHSLAEELRKFPARLYTCHCTGEGAYQFLQPILGDQLSYLSTGMEIEI